jgi:hypothetical protein
MIKESANVDAPPPRRHTQTRLADSCFLRKRPLTSPPHPPTPRNLYTLPRNDARPRRRSYAVTSGQVRRVLVGDRGAVSAELVIAIPLVLFMLLAIVQFALWSHATHIAQAAAAQGLAACRAQDGTAADGQASAQHLLDELGQGPLTAASIVANRTADSASIQITGTALAVIPLLHISVHAEAAGPAERFVPIAGGT